MPPDRQQMVERPAAGVEIDQRIVSTDQNRDRTDLALADGGKNAGLLDLDIARTARKEDKPDIIGPRLRRGVNDGRRPHAADFNLDRHVQALG